MKLHGGDGSCYQSETSDNPLIDNSLDKHQACACVCVAVFDHEHTLSFTLSEDLEGNDLFIILK